MTGRVEGTSRGMTGFPVVKKRRTEKTTSFKFFTYLDDDCLVKIGQFLTDRSLALMAVSSRNWAKNILSPVKLELGATLLQDCRGVDLRSEGFIEEIGIDPKNFSLELRSYSILLATVTEVFLSRFIKGENLQEIQFSFYPKTWACISYSLIMQARTASKWESLKNQITKLSKLGFFRSAVQVLQFIPENVLGHPGRLQKELLETIFKIIIKNRCPTQFLKAFKEIQNEGWQLAYKLKLVKKLIRMGSPDVAAQAIENLPVEEQSECFHEVFYALLQKEKKEEAKEVAKKLPEEEESLIDLIENGDVHTETDILNNIRNLITHWSEDSYDRALALADSIYDHVVSANIEETIESALALNEPTEI